MNIYHIKISAPGADISSTVCRAVSLVAALRRAQRLAPKQSKVEIWDNGRCLYSGILSYRPNHAAAHA